MARRRIGGDDDGALEAMFLQRPQGGGDMAGQLGVMLQLLGMGPQQQQAREEAGLKREELEALNAYRMGGLEQAGAKTASDIALAESQMALNEQLKKASTDEARERIEFQKQQLANQAMESRLGVAKTMMADTSIPIADRQRMWAEFEPAIKGMLATGAEQANKRAAQGLIPQIQAVYGKPEELKNLLAAVPEDVLQRPEIPWGSMNEELWKQGQRTASGNAGLAGLLWNVPGMAQNVGKGIANLASRGLMGAQAPQVPYTEFTNPMTEVPKYREAQAVLEALKAPGQSVGPAPEEPMGGYSTGPVAQEQPWTYGTGTRQIPAETIPVPVPMPMPPVGETLSAGVIGMPPVSLGTLLRKLGIGAQGAEAPFGMPGQEEPMPWQYGVGGMR